MKPAPMMDFRTVSTPAILPPKAAAPSRSYGSWPEDDLAQIMARDARAENHRPGFPDSEKLRQRSISVQREQASQGRINAGARRKAAANERVFEAISGEMTARQIADALGITSGSVHARILELEAAGRVRRIKDGHQHLFTREGRA